MFYLLEDYLCLSYGLISCEHFLIFFFIVCTFYIFAISITYLDSVNNNTLVNTAIYFRISLKLDYLFMILLPIYLVLLLIHFDTLF